MSCNCPTNFYKTPYNKNYQSLYCNLAQRADTDLETAITSGWSYNKEMSKHNNVPVVENYCGCGIPKTYVNTPMSEYYDPRASPSKAPAQAVDGKCPTDYLKTPFNVAYQNLYSGLAQRTDTNLVSFQVQENYSNANSPYNYKTSIGTYNPRTNTEVFYSR